jgi:response regulator of citrate/malate metabolism
LEVCRALRIARTDVDVIAVTANRDLASVRAAMSLGVVQYLLKPFTFRSLQDKLERYRDVRTQLRTEQVLAGQGDIDRALASLRQVSEGGLPTGLSADTLETISRTMRQGIGMSALEVADTCGVSRVTARRYLEHLVEAGAVRRQQRHHRNGRPEVEYTWTVPR